MSSFEGDVWNEFLEECFDRMNDGGHVLLSPNRRGRNTLFDFLNTCNDMYELTTIPELEHIFYISRIENA
jgi:hypothetical protein